MRLFPRRPKLRCSLLLVAILLGCGERGPPSPDEQYRRAIAALREGSLSRAYDEVMPASYDRDLNEVLSRARSLITEEEFGRIQDLASRAGEKLTALLETRRDRGPIVGLLALKARELPAILGLDSLAGFQGRDMRAVLSLIDERLFADLARTEEIQGRLRALDVGILHAKGTWARIRFKLRGQEGAGGQERESLEDRDVDLLEGKWVFGEWVVEWPGQVARWRASLDELAMLKRKDPGAIREGLSSAERLIDSLPALVESFLESLRVFDVPVVPAGKE